MPGRDCSIGGGSQHASSAPSSSLSVLMGARGLSAAAPPASFAITSTALAIRQPDSGLRAPRCDCADYAAAALAFLKARYAGIRVPANRDGPHEMSDLSA